MMDAFCTADPVYKGILSKVLAKVAVSQMNMLNVQYDEVDPSLAKNVEKISEEEATLSQQESVALAGADGKGTDSSCKLYAIMQAKTDDQGKSLTVAQTNYEVEQKKWENWLQQRQQFLQSFTQTLQAHTQSLQTYTQLGKALTDLLAYQAQNQLH